MLGHVLAIVWMADETPSKLNLAAWLDELGVKPSKITIEKINKKKDGQRTFWKRNTKLLQQECWVGLLIQGRATDNKLTMLSGKLLCPFYQ